MWSGVPHDRCGRHGQLVREAACCGWWAGALLLVGPPGVPGTAARGEDHRHLSAIQGLVRSNYIIEKLIFLKDLDASSSCIPGKQWDRVDNLRMTEQTR